jgi:hypothetical protein
VLAPLPAAPVPIAAGVVLGELLPIDPAAPVLLTAADPAVIGELGVTVLGDLESSDPEHAASVRAASAHMNH